MEFSTEQVIDAGYGQDDPEVEKAYKALERYLGDTAPRFYIPHGANFGHQASTLQFLKRFIALGIIKRAEIVYHSEETLEKLRKLLPQMGDGALPFDVSSGGRTVPITVVAVEHVSGQARLAISGGWDYTPAPEQGLFEELKRKRKPVDADPPSASEGAKKPPFLDEEIAALKSTVVIAVQPFTWETETTKINSFVHVASRKKPFFLGEELKEQKFEYMFYRRPRPQLADTAWKTLLEMPGKRETVAAAMAVLEGVRGRRLFCPVYGIADGPAATRNSPPVTVALFNLAGMIRVLQEDEPQFKKGAVVLLLRGLKDETWTAVKTRFEENPQDDPVVRNFTLKYLHAHGKANVIVRQDERDAKAISEAIESLQADEVLILSLDGLPQDVFDLMYAEATLPSLFEGAGTAGLAVSLGLPYIRFSPIACPVLPLGGEPTKESSAAQKAAESIATTPNSWKTAEVIPPVALAGHVRDSYDQAKPQHAYFAALGSHLQKNPVQDKLTAALKWVVDKQLLPKYD
ncbi:hypothetical protein GCM10010191_04720 [Actinomadura vinacea]|uniref:Uncharacterized protein n=1 Tax=Actinomadura vinacea TaxID=115336 RepID=A0ABN3IEA3_9ACTN